MSCTTLRYILLLLVSLLSGGSLQSEENPKWELTDFVWNLGMAASCDIGPDKDPRKLFPDYGDPAARLNKDAFEAIKSGDIVWVCAYCVPLFNEKFLPNIKVPFVLVISNGDESFPSQFVADFDVDKFIGNKNIVHIFAQNCDYKGSSGKVSHLPIGMDFHSVGYKGGYWGETGSPHEQEKRLKALLKEFQPTHLRKMRAFVDFQLNDSIRYGGGNRHLQWGEDRTTIFQRLLRSGLIDFSGRMNRSDLWKKKGEYAFSISPHGNGLDCHRTWEDLILGCIVIVKTSPLDPLYEGLPVVIVKDWGEVTQTNMEKWIKQYGDAFTNPTYREKLTNKYWLDKIREAAKPYKKPTAS